MRIRLLTYNIHRAIGVDRRFRPERIVAILRRYDADIVLLQEVDHSVPRSKGLDLAQHLKDELAFEHHALGLNVTLRRGWYGNATLSRFAIGPQRNIDLTLGGVKGRGAQHTRLVLVDAPTPQTLDVFNVHLSLTARHRARQVAHLLATPDVQGLAPDQPCIVAGDLNDWRALLGLRFAAAGFVCATDRADGRPLRTYPSFAPSGGLDRVFYRGGLRLLRHQVGRLDLARLASDHLPVVVDFELTAPLPGPVPARPTRRERRRRG